MITYTDELPGMMSGPALANELAGRFKAAKDGVNAALQVRDDWNAETKYDKNDIVKRAGVRYVALASSTNVVPGTDGAKWDVFGGGGSSAWADITNKPATFAPSAHATSHEHGGSDAIGNAVAGANRIVKSQAGGEIDAAYLPAGTTTTKGAVLLAADGSATAGRAVLATDARLSNVRTPTAHAATHANGGTDALTPAQIGAIATVARGAVNGVASLGADSKVPLEQLPDGIGGGVAGANGWTPQLAVVADGARRVHQVAGWTGGTGTAPASGGYLGAAGVVAAIGDATDIRGATGADGAGSGGGNSALSIAVAATASPLTLSATQRAANTLIFSGTRSALLDVSSTVAGSWAIKNATTQTIRFLSAAGSAKRAIIATGETRLITTDLTNIYYSAALMMAVNVPAISTTGLKMYLANGNGITSTTWTDQSGLNNNATLSNGAAPATTAGLSGVAFDGVNDVATVPSVFALGTGNATLFTRANFSSASLKGFLLNVGASNNGASSNGYGIGVGNGDLDTNGNALIGLLNGVAFLNSNAAIGTGVHSLAMTKNGTAFRLFVDGVFVYAASGTAYAPTVSTTVGAGTGGAHRLFSGIAFDAVVYNTALTDNEVLALHQSFS